METTTNRIEFSKNGMAFTIHFKDGGESLEITSKQEGLQAVIKLLEDKKISSTDFEKMCAQIVTSKNLSWSDGPQVNDFVIGGGRLGDLLGELLGGGLFGSGKSFEDMADTMAHPDEPVTEPYFKPCENCGNHGRIYTKDVYTRNLEDKAAARKALERLKEKKHISTEEHATVLKQIEASSLSEEAVGPSRDRINKDIEAAISMGPVEEATLKISDSGKGARIYTKAGGMTSEFQTQRRGVDYLDFLEEHNHVSKEEKIELLKS